MTKKLWNLSTFLVKYDSIVVGTFCIHFWSTFWKKLTVYAVFGSQIVKNVYILDIFCLILYCFFVRLFTYFFELFITCFVNFFFKNHVFSCFSEKHNYHDFPFRHCIVHDRVMVICASLWNFYLNIFLFFCRKCDHFVRTFVHLFCYFLRFFMIFTIFCKRRSVEHAEFAIHLGCRKPCFCNFWHIYTRKIMKF